MTKYLQQLFRVPLNGTDTWNTITSMPESGHRAARFYNYKMNELPSVLPVENRNGPHGLGDPFVIAAVIAGLAGITLSIIIILSIWILRRAKHSSERSKTPIPLEEVKCITNQPSVERVEREVIVVTLPDRPKRPYIPKETPV